MTEKDKLYADKLKERALSDYERLDRAINELEQQSSYNSVKTELKPCEDCIRRAEVLNLLKGIEILHYHDELRSNLIYEIMNLPSVTPQPKVGHWITTRTFMHDGEYYCDKCKCDAPNNEKWDYCPNCGVKMEVARNEQM